LTVDRGPGTDSRRSSSLPSSEFQEGEGRAEEHRVLHEVDELLLFLLRVVDSFRPPIRQ
jgi:hypothetical protein